MNLLVLTNNPQRASFRQRIGIYLDYLLDCGIFCEVCPLPRGSWARRKLFKRGAEFDAVILHKKRLNIFDAYWLKRYQRKLIYDFDDAVMYDERRPDINSPARRRLFFRTIKLADLVIAGNEYLAEHVRPHHQNVVVLPTGLSLKDYPLDARKENDGRIRLVWIGSKSTLRYLYHIADVLAEIGRRFPSAVLRIIADEFFDLPSLPVEKITWSLAAQGPALAAGDIGLAPLPDDPYTRGKCGFKILQYHAVGLPVVASPVGVNRTLVREGITGFLAQDENNWIDKITLLMQNDSLRAKMGAAGKQEVEKSFDLNILGRRLCQLIKDTVSS